MTDFSGIFLSNPLRAKEKLQVPITTRHPSHLYRPLHNVTNVTLHDSQPLGLTPCHCQPCEFPDAIITGNPLQNLTCLNSHSPRDVVHVVQIRPSNIARKLDNLDTQAWSKIVTYSRAILTYFAIVASLCKLARFFIFASSALHIKTVHYSSKRYFSGGTGKRGIARITRRSATNARVRGCLRSESRWFTFDAIRHYPSSIPTCRVCHELAS